MVSLVYFFSVVQIKKIRFCALLFATSIYPPHKLLFAVKRRKVFKAYIHIDIHSGFDDLRSHYDYRRVFLAFVDDKLSVGFVVIPAKFVYVFKPLFYQIVKLSSALFFDKIKKEFFIELQTI